MADGGYFILLGAFIAISFFVRFVFMKGGI